MKEGRFHDRAYERTILYNKEKVLANLIDSKNGHSAPT